MTSTSVIFARWSLPNRKLLIAFFGVCFAAQPTLSANEHGKRATDDPATTTGDTPWHRLDVPRGAIHGIAARSSRTAITDLAIEPKGGLWVMGNQGVYYLTGSQFETPKGEAMRSGQYLTTLWGGGDRPLYATQPSNDSTAAGNQGRILRLSDGTASFVTNFYYDAGSDYPGIHVTKAGHIINWGQTFVAKFDGTDWKRHEANLGRQAFLVESRDAVHLLSGNHVFTIDSKGDLTSHELDVPLDTAWIQPVLWGDDKLMLIDNQQRKLLALKLPEFTRIEIREASLAKSWVDLAFRAPDGSVWLSHQLPGVYPKRVLHRLTTDGKVEWIDSGNFPAWSSSYMRAWPESALFAKDGTVWLLSKSFGILSLKNGRVQRYGWREGLAEGGARAILQDHAGNIYAGFSHGVWMMPADGPRSRLPDWTRIWTEHPLASARPVQDDSQKLWMALASQPKAISCWDGTKFLHRAVPFETSRIQLFLVDDQEHVLVVLMEPHSGVACRDIGPQHAAAFASLEDMLVAAVKRGARKFRSNNELSGPVVDRQQRIWYGPRNGEHIRMYNGTQWLDLSGYSHVHSTTTGDVLVSGNERFARYEKGVLVPSTPHVDANRVRIYGPKGITPFEPVIYAHAPQDFLLVEKQGTRRLVQPTFDPAGLTEPWKFEPRDNSPNYMGDYVTRGRFGSHWSTYCACDLYRLFAGYAFLSDFNSTPVDGQSYITSNLFDDPAGNLWIHRGTWWNGRNSMFMKDTSQFQLKPLVLPETIPSNSLHTVSATDALGQQVDPHLLSQIDDGPWVRGQLAGELLLTFHRPGKHRVRVLAIGPQAELCCKPLDFTCNVHDADTR